MKTTVKKVIIAAVVIGFVFGMSSCDKHTCPTYSKADVQTTGTRA